MVSLFPLETQDQRVPKNVPGALPYSRYYVNQDIGRPFPFMDFGNDLVDGLEFMAAEGNDDSDAFSAKAARVLKSPMKLAKYVRDRRRLNEYDNETIYEMMLSILAQRGNVSIPSGDGESNLMKLTTNSRNVNIKTFFSILFINN